MDVFNLRTNLMRSYEDFIRSFIKIHDERIFSYVDGQIKGGLLFPDPLIQLNPSYASGGSVDDLVNEGILHSECKKIFRRNKNPDNYLDIGKEISLHRHQELAIRTAAKGNNYILTTGTGSGKSLTYIIPIVDYVLKNNKKRGIKAIIVYPMNALANSQMGELEKFLNHGYPDNRGPVTFARYTGQENERMKEEIISNPPDILLTNYVMLELILTRPNEKQIVNAAEGLKYLVFDELHTYRGRMGSDVALLIRRAREFFGGNSLQCVGTSATLAGYDNSIAEQKIQAAEVASKIFGSLVLPDNVIVETLERSTPDMEMNDILFIESLKTRLQRDWNTPTDWKSFVEDPLSIWIESTFGVERDQISGGLKRASPKSIRGPKGAATILSTLTGLDESLCACQIEKHLIQSYLCEPNPITGFPVFAFRLHQFISRGDTVYSSLENPDDRYITINQQQFVPNDRGRILYPMVFCRECGQEYYSVKGISESQDTIEKFIQRRLNDRQILDDEYSGYLYHSQSNPWPSTQEQIFERLPDGWLDIDNDKISVNKNYRANIPQSYNINTMGEVSSDGEPFAFIKSPFKFCLNCGVAYGARQSEFSKLTTLATEGRSSATSLLALETIEALRKENTIPDTAKKLLSFTDNRQDASLQAGHFNDFMEVGLLRSALYKAISDAGSEGLAYDDLVQSVFKTLDLDPTNYAQEPESKYQAKIETEKALRNVIGYRIYSDLKRGWRLTSPNLEQCGLLEIDFVCLDELCKDNEEWTDTHQLLRASSHELRKEISKTLLDFIRRELAIKVSYFDINNHDKMTQQSDQRLKAPWAFDDDEKLIFSKIVYPQAKKGQDDGSDLYISARGRFGQYLKRRFRNPGVQLKTGDVQQIIADLFSTLRKPGLLEQTVDKSDNCDMGGYQIPASAMRWRISDGTKPFKDHIRILQHSDDVQNTNDFFIDFYRRFHKSHTGIEAREHTAQVHHEIRSKREELFREGKLPILFCSPTMELGVDIADLNVVNLRNIPPTPANYAQRSGRAGRSGQPALVFSYSSTFSSHDQYFFNRPERMVSGVVNPPRLDLANEDLIKSHVHSIWLAESGMSLGVTLKDVLNIENEHLDTHDHIRETLNHQQFKIRTKERCQKVLSTLEGDLRQTDWYSDKWLEEVLNSLSIQFKRACDRWRHLYRSAKEQRDKQDKRATDYSLTPNERQKAKKLRSEAEAQLNLLMENKSVVESDFYSYRYFAAEGFLPGYSFPRLPLSAYVPGKRGRDEFLSRPRFIAITEFGPRSIVYHEGNRYRINKVILPVQDRNEEGDIPTLSAKICEACGYIHYIVDSAGPDLCQQCNAPLPIPMDSLFRMQNVSTKKVDRINSDEEERQRYGFDILTAYRFAEVNGRQSYRLASVQDTTRTEIASMKYGQSATISRINLGWSKKKEHFNAGFLLDTEKGEWAKNDQDKEDSGEDVKVKKRIIPYVEDNKNCLIFEPRTSMSEVEMASLQAALKNAIQIEYHLEDSELAAEPLPSSKVRKSILFYESAEGGAGVLRHLANDPSALSRIAERALDHCHFGLDGTDLKRGPKSNEDCEAACYDCLMSYTNQRDHSILDRKSIEEILMEYKSCSVEKSPGPISRGDHLERLLNRCDSELERRWLNLLEQNQLNLPEISQKVVASCEAKPDFQYPEHYTMVFIDGPPHDHDYQIKKDKQQRDCLEDLGYKVIVFRHDDDWHSIIKQNRNVFGDIQ